MKEAPASWVTIPILQDLLLAFVLRGFFTSPISSAVLRIFSATSGSTLPRLLSARSTVPRETPVASAICCTVTAKAFSSFVCFISISNHYTGFARSKQEDIKNAQPLCTQKPQFRPPQTRGVFATKPCFVIFNAKRSCTGILWCAVQLLFHLFSFKMHPQDRAARVSTFQHLSGRDPGCGLPVTGQAPGQVL